MKKIFTCFLLITCLGLVSCTDKKSPVNNAMVENTLGYFLQDVVKGYKLDTAIFIHTTRYQDVISSFPDDHFSTSVKNPEYRNVIKLFEQHMREPSSLQFDHFNGDHLTVVEDNKDNERFFKDPAYFGTLYLSNGIEDAAGQMGAYYVALNCGDKCSAGFIILTEMENGKWKRKERLLIWESK